MTVAERRAFLQEGGRTGKLATVRPDGRPHVAPVWFVLDGDDVIFTTWHETVKATNLEHDPRVALLVDEEEPPFAFVLVEGVAEIDKQAPDMLRWTTRLAARYMGDDLAEEFGRRNAVEGEWLVRIRPAHFVARKEIAD
ncbi:MAG: PPOX class F420-dependent oxidoreductase [Anaerolineae bacterium]|nr:PPOX class F420-dependent oxidoreductase [Anaerolineae bacterium]